jgi:hypothetical protein
MKRLSFAFLGLPVVLTGMLAGFGSAVMLPSPKPLELGLGLAEVLKAHQDVLVDETFDSRDERERYGDRNAPCLFEMTANDPAYNMPGALTGTPKFETPEGADPIPEVLEGIANRDVQVPR